MHAKLTTHSPHLCPPRGQIFSSNVFGTLSIHIPSIFLLLVIVDSLVDVFQEGGWRMSAECAHFI
jgi:hypothetical protein